MKNHITLAEARNSFIHFCSHWHSLSKEQLLNDVQFSKFIANQMAQNPMLYRRVFQLAFEVAYHKRQFNLQECLNAFDHKFSVKSISSSDPINVIDQSTLFSMFQTQYLQPFFNNLSIDVYATPKTLPKPEEQTLSLQKKIMFNKQCTSNAVPDIEINGMPYDYKGGEDFSLAKNHIMFISIEVLNSPTGAAILYKMHSVLQQRVHFMRISDSKELIASLIGYRNFIGILLKENLPVTQKFEILLDFRKSKLLTGKDENLLPIYIPAPSEFMTSPLNDLVEKIKLPPSKLNSSNSSKILHELASQLPWDSQKNAFYSTQGVFKPSDEHDLTQ